MGNSLRPWRQLYTMCPNIHNVALCFGGGHSLKSGYNSHVRGIALGSVRRKILIRFRVQSQISALRQAVGRCVHDSNQQLHSGLSSVAFNLLARCGESPDTILVLLCLVDGPCWRSSKLLASPYEDVVHVSVVVLWQAYTARVGVTWRFLKLGPLYHREEGSVECSRSGWCVVRARSVVSVCECCVYV
jgi:hypothetical protein